MHVNVNKKKVLIYICRLNGKFFIAISNWKMKSAVLIEETNSYIA